MSQHSQSLRLSKSESCWVRLISFLRSSEKDAAPILHAAQPTNAWAYGNTPVLRALARHSFRHYSASLRAKPKAIVIFPVLLQSQKRVFPYAPTSRLSAPLISPLLCVSACKTQSNRHFPGFIAITKGRISIRPYFVSLLETDYLITHFLLFCACKTSSRQPSKKTHFAIHHQHSIFVP